jgi:hypothetical protein
MEKPEHPKKTDGQPTAKRAYDTPRLSVYGDLRLRTLGMATGSRTDGGTHPNNMT